MQKWGGQPLKKDSPETAENMECNFKLWDMMTVRNFLVLTEHADTHVTTSSDRICFHKNRVRTWEWLFIYIIYPDQ
jgi:hypothetical protein